jgi:hypothetical protein
VRDFQEREGPALQKKLEKYASKRSSYIEQFCMTRSSLLMTGYDSYLNFDNRMFLVEVTNVSCRSQPKPIVSRS